MKQNGTGQKTLLIWRQTNKYVYEDDSPRSRLRTNLSDTLLKEVLYSSHLRPRFSEELIRSFQQKLHRVAPGYSPDTAEELLQWVRERLYIPAKEWEELLAAIRRDHGHHGVEVENLIETIGDRLYRIESNGSLTAMTALENLPRVSHALNIAAEDAQAAEKNLGTDQKRL